MAGMSRERFKAIMKKSAEERKSRISPSSFLADLNCLKDGWATEYQFFPGRKCAFDYANPRCMIAIEIEGGTWIRGRHSRGTGFALDCKKYNAAERRGWTVLRYPDDNKKLLKSTVKTALRDVRAILTGIDVDGQLTLGEPIQARLLSEKFPDKEHALGCNYIKCEHTDA